MRKSPAQLDLLRGGASSGEAPITAELVASRLRSGVPLLDVAFDRFLPPRLRRVAAQHWTPLGVAQRIAVWLSDLSIGSVVDLGSGAGKFCVAAALAAPHCRFTGIEQRGWVADAAREVARLFHVDDRVEFITGALGETPIPPAAAYYLYNPFGENLFDADSHIDEEVELSGSRYTRDVANIARLLVRQPPGTFVIKYNGYGGKMPRDYDVIRRDTAQPELLRMWRKHEPPVQTR